MHRYIGQKLVSTDIVKIAVDIDFWQIYWCVSSYYFKNCSKTSGPIYIANEQRTDKRKKCMLCV